MMARLIARFSGLSILYAESSTRRPGREYGCLRSGAGEVFRVLRPAGDYLLGECARTGLGQSGNQVTCGGTQVAKPLKI